jgi:hypothetical protein
MRIVMFDEDAINYSAKRLIYSLKFRSETLKKLTFRCFDLQGIDLSFISKLERLEQLEFDECIGFTPEHCETLYKEKLHLKKLVLWCDNEYEFDLYSNVMEAFINSFCGEALLKLALNIVTPKTIKAMKESCLNIRILRIEIHPEGGPLDQIIPPICELPLLKVLSVETSKHGVDIGSLVKILGDHLMFVKYLLLGFFPEDLSSFEYFTNNCKANLKKWKFYSTLTKDHLLYVNNYQKVHNSLKVLGFKYAESRWTNDELEIIDSLKNQGINIVTFG